MFEQGGVNVGGERARWERAGKDLLATDDGRDAGTPVCGVQRGSRARLSVRRERREMGERQLGSRRVEGRRHCRTMESKMDETRGDDTTVDGAP